MTAMPVDGTACSPKEFKSRESGSQVEVQLRDCSDRKIVPESTRCGNQGTVVAHFKPVTEEASFDQAVNVVLEICVRSLNDPLLEIITRRLLLAEVDDEAEVPPADPPIPNRIPVWKPLTLRVLFGGAESRTRKPSAKVMEEEELFREELANAAEDEIPDDGSIEIDSDDEFRA
ncbi:hypothetical protein C8F04DRAFT_1191390 [Mycena alexandri]|uniref:Uncharacterized protein n=1 Tax=Mycena alexandri TaxID=1745969 RepID=A0AAD6SHD3_9AGAR|nr:hypothetical protein C8F04DRAFT_1191390 [Mycena alexandri]